MLTLDKIYHAAFVLKDVARKTDLIEAPKLSKDCQLYLKTENLQATGSFKVRGAYYKISQLSEEESAKGVIACSAGNHAQGVALAATRRGIRSIVCMPDGAPLMKVENTKNLGAEVPATDHRLYAGRRTPDEGGKHQKSGRGGLPCARHLRRSPRQGRAAAKGVRHDLYPPLR